MKHFKLHLSIGAPTYLKAERYEEKGLFYCFFRNGTMIAEFPKLSVLKIDELHSPTRDELNEPPHRRTPQL